MLKENYVKFVKVILCVVGENKGYKVVNPRQEELEDGSSTATNKAKDKGTRKKLKNPIHKRLKQELPWTPLSPEMVKSNWTCNCKWSK